MSKGRVYIVKNPLFPTLFKLGFTTKNSVEERGLSASNLPEAFEVIREYECDDCEETEKLFRELYRITQNQLLMKLIKFFHNIMVLPMKSWIFFVNYDI